MNRYRPTSLRIYSEACPAALKFFIEQQEGGHAHGHERMDSYKVPEREIEGNEAAEVGIAFHAVVHSAAEAQKAGRSVLPVMEATALVLCNKMDAARASAGHDMAMSFVQNWKFDPRLDYEYGLAFNGKWKAAKWEDEDVRLRMVLDVFGIVEEGDENGTSKVAISEDYKTGWGANATIVDSIQMKCHSSALLSLYEREVDFIEVRVHATRFKKIFTKRWDLNLPGDLEDLRKRREDVEFMMNAADRSDFQPRIGVGCINCDFSGKCTAFQKRLTEMKSGDVVNIAADPEAAAKDYAIVLSECKRLAAGLREATKNRSIAFGEMILGYHAEQKRRVNDPTQLVEFWFEKAGKCATPEEAKSMARALMRAMSPGVTQLDNMIKKIARHLGYKSQAAAIEELSPRFATVEEQAKFKWKKNAALDNRDEEAE